MRCGLLLLVATLALIASCDSGTAPTDDGAKPIVEGELMLVGPEHYALLVGEKVKYSVLIHDCGAGCGPQAIDEIDEVDWSSSDPEIASVANGRVSAHQAGSVMITGTVGFVASGNQTDEVTAQVTVAESFVSLASISGGSAVTCGVTAGGTAYCWGNTTDSDPTTPNLSKFGDEVSPRALSGLSNVTSVTAARSEALVLAGSETYEWGGGGTLRPIVGAPAFRLLTAGGRSEGGSSFRHACGVALDDETYCWGSNDSGQLGTDSVAFSTPTPVRVDTDVRFASVTAGGAHSCGLTADGRAHCWGDNRWGQLGDASTAVTRQPVAVNGGLVFSELSAGIRHTCGLTADGAAYCWGANDESQLGLSTADSDPHSTPQRVGAARSFTTLDAGSFTCALDPLGDPYCWGGDFGSAPTHLPGQLSFRSLTVGSAHACGIPDSGRPRCWGSNGVGQLGVYLGADTTFTDRPVPLAGPVEP